MLGHPGPPWLILSILLPLRTNNTFLDPGEGGPFLEIPSIVNSIASLGLLSLTIGLFHMKSALTPCCYTYLSSFVKFISVITGDSIDTGLPFAPLTKDYIKILINQPKNKYASGINYMQKSMVGLGRSTKRRQKKEPWTWRRK